VQKLSDLLGGTLVGQPQSAGGAFSSRGEESIKSDRSEEAIYVVTIIAPITAASVEDGKIILRSEVLARSHGEAMAKAGVTSTRG